MPIASINPATEEPEVVVETHTSLDVEHRLKQASAAAATLRDTDFATRRRWMETSADLLEGEIELVASMLTREMGKPISQARAEVRKSVHAMRFYAANAETFLQPLALEDPLQVGASRAWTQFEPLGLVLAVMPWNYPIWQVIRFAAPALMAGNAGLLKHASNVPGAAAYLESLFARSGWPSGTFMALFVDSGVVAGIVEDRRVAAVTLTGSERAGRSVASTAGKALKKVVLELGGSDPFLVMPSADLGAAARAACQTRTANNGQACIAGKRFIVHTDVYDDFVEMFGNALDSLVVGDPLDEQTDVGPMASRSGRDDLWALIDDAVGKGASRRTCSPAVAGQGWYLRPVLLEGVTPDMRIFHEEAFGPVATVFRVDSLNAAINLANATNFGLSSAVWSDDRKEQEVAISRLEAGAVFVNGVSTSFPELPFGGVKASGLGRELGAEGIRELSVLKTVWEA
jgi:succinate-semialdehyde dehydrogenase/glutarate-semialdehyde dehydrogenase